MQRLRAANMVAKSALHYGLAAIVGTSAGFVVPEDWFGQMLLGVVGFGLVFGIFAAGSAQEKSRCRLR